MNIIEVSSTNYYILIKKYKGLLFHRISNEDKNDINHYLIKPLKSIEQIILTYKIN